MPNKTARRKQAFRARLRHGGQTPVPIAMPEAQALEKWADHSEQSIFTAFWKKIKTLWSSDENAVHAAEETELLEQKDEDPPYPQPSPCKPNLYFQFLNVSSPEENGTYCFVRIPTGEYPVTGAPCTDTSDTFFKTAHKYARCQIAQVIPPSMPMVAGLVGYTSKALDSGTCGQDIRYYGKLFALTGTSLNRTSGLEALENAAFPEQTPNYLAIVLLFAACVLCCTGCHCYDTKSRENAEKAWRRRGEERLQKLQEEKRLIDERNTLLDGFIISSTCASCF